MFCSVRYWVSALITVLFLYLPVLLSIEHSQDVPRSVVPLLWPDVGHHLSGMWIRRGNLGYIFKYSQSNMKGKWTGQFCFKYIATPLHKSVWKQKFTFPLEIVGVCKTLNVSSLYTLRTPRNVEIAHLKLRIAAGPETPLSSQSPLCRGGRSLRGRFSPEIRSGTRIWTHFYLAPKQMFSPPSKMRERVAAVSFTSRWQRGSPQVEQLLQGHSGRVQDRQSPRLLRGLSLIPPLVCMFLSFKKSM